jgi:competence protein CoiA
MSHASVLEWICFLIMLSARRKCDRQIVTAYLESKSDGPFVCSVCNEEVLLRTGRYRINHFAHANPIACKFAIAESDDHLRCKMEIYEALQKEPCVRDVALERSFEVVRPDVSAQINGASVAIEVQISSLSLETIQVRTIEYARKGIYVLWLLQWRPELDAKRYAPRIWEKWIHAAYFGRVYYWIEGLKVVSYRFDPSFKTVPQKTWYSKRGDKVTAGGYSRRSKRYRTPIRGKTFNLATDFVPRTRYWWQGNGLKVPDAKLFMQPYDPDQSEEFQGGF